MSLLVEEMRRERSRGKVEIEIEETENRPHVTCCFAIE